MYKLPLTGGCQCDAIRYEITEAPLTFYACHCKDCQKQSSSAFGLSLWTTHPSFNLTTGTLAVFDTTGESGARKRCSFCNQCGSRIHHGFSVAEGYYSIKAGTLDSLEGLAPVAHIWTNSAQPWSISIDDPTPQFPKEPANDEILLRLWQQRHVTQVTDY